jgi:SAM-dependent methyltransferase
MALRVSGKGRVTAKGLEPMVKKQKAARERGLNVTDFDLQTHKEQYDCISLLNVYSHLPNPPEFFQILKRCLKTCGEVLVETGDSANLIAEDQCRPFYLPSHLSFASEEIITGILRKLGFEIVAVKKYPAFDLSYIFLTAIKEAIKIALPGKSGHMGQVCSMYRLSKKAPTDMYIRAVLKD